MKCSTKSSPYSNASSGSRIEPSSANSHVDERFTCVLASVPILPQEMCARKGGTYDTLAQDRCVRGMVMSARGLCLGTQYRLGEPGHHLPSTAGRSSECSHYCCGRSLTPSAHRPRRQSGRVWPCVPGPRRDVYQRHRLLRRDLHHERSVLHARRGLV